jgi:hypothetical protein
VFLGGGHGVGDVDDRDEVDEQVEVVEDFAVAAGGERGRGQGQGVDVDGSLEVFDQPGRVGEVAGDVGGGVVPRVLAGDRPGLGEVQVAGGQAGRYFGVRVVGVRARCGQRGADGTASGLINTGGGGGADPVQFVGDAAQACFGAAAFVCGQFPREVDAGGVVAGVSVFGQDREVEAGVVDADGGPHPAGIPGEPVDAVAEADGLTFALLDPHGQQFVLGPVPQLLLDAVGHRLFRGGLFAVGVGSGHGDGLLASQDVRHDGLDEHGRVAELPLFPGVDVAGYLGEFGGLVVVVGGQQLVRGEAFLVLFGDPHGVGFGEGAPVGHAFLVVAGVDGLVVQPRPGVNDDLAQAHRYSFVCRPRA